MEDGDISEMEVSAPINAAETNEFLNKMANYPDVEVTVIKNKNNTECKTTSEHTTTKVNGESEHINCNSDEQEFTSDEDCLIIDEDYDELKSNINTNNCKRLRSPSPRGNFKGFKKRVIEHSLRCLQIVNGIREEKPNLYNELVEISNNIKEEEEERHHHHHHQQQQQHSISIQGELIDDNTTSISNKDHIKNQYNIEPSTTTTTLLPLTNQKPNKKSLITASSNITSLRKNKKHLTILKSSGNKQPSPGNKKRPSEKLTEYAQYLGLQPAVKFKCVKCSESRFPSLTALNEHQRQCLTQSIDQTSVSKQSSTSSASVPSSTAASVSTSSTPSLTNIRVTRKVFLCSACGTYYENCNLFLHMRDVHRRYICLYCLGLFAYSEKLYHHITTKHIPTPKRYTNGEDFLSEYTESCYLVCTVCEHMFSERGKFDEHVCVEKRTVEKSCKSCGVKGPNATHLHTCRTATNDQQLPPPASSSSSNQKSSHSKSIIHPKTQKHKTNRNHQKNNLTTFQHVTADDASTSTLMVPNDIGDVDDDDKTGGHFLADITCDNAVPELLHSTQTITENSTSETNCFNNSLDMNQVNNITETMDYCETNNETSDTLKTVDHIPMETENIINVSDLENKTSDFQEPCENVDENKIDEIDEEQEEVGEEEEEENNDDDDDGGNDHKNVSRKNSENDSSLEVNSILTSNRNVSDSNEITNINENTSDKLEHKLVENSESTITETTTTAATTATITTTTTTTTTGEIKDEQTQYGENNLNNVKEETRKVPKVKLKLGPDSLTYFRNESNDDSDNKMAVDENSDHDYDESQNDESKLLNESGDDKPVNGMVDENEMNHSDLNQSDDDSIQVAGEDVSLVELQLEQPLDKFDIKDLLKTCLTPTTQTCTYCNQSRKIAVDGKQLALHAIAEHRFSATVNSITAEELIPQNFVDRIKSSLDEIDSVYITLEEPQKIIEEIRPDGLYSNFNRVYECFQCRMVTSVHKEIYLHNRKSHSKNILLCIICKGNFFTYSEYICHLCPGNYVLHHELKYRCCMCETELPSQFRLMVHLRKRHHTCDVCLESCQNQSKLSNHVWKHKLHHLCYRCGIAYRNKPDITKHLFWKHGTQSVLCNKCLQKKWPHIYHFCVPPALFVCEECTLSFTRAVSLKVHKRLHSKYTPHECTVDNCTEKFISKKLLMKHEMQHRNPVPIESLSQPISEENKENINTENEVEQKVENVADKDPSSSNQDGENREKKLSTSDKEDTKPKSVLDVYNIPELNLSESDSSESEDEKAKPSTTVAVTAAEATTTTTTMTALTATTSLTTMPLEPEKMIIDDADVKLETLTSILPATNDVFESHSTDDQVQVPILDGIWDNFKNYQATVEKNNLNIDMIIKNNNNEDDVSNITTATTTTTTVATTIATVTDTDTITSSSTITTATTTSNTITANEEQKAVAPDYSQMLDVIFADHDYCIVENGREIQELSEDIIKIGESTELDHDYCTVSSVKKPDEAAAAENTNENQRSATPENTETKKKVKTPKKKSSSSSDSSSDTDSSSCSCGSNCSCSSSSDGEGSSSSSSSSSDSDSSSSETKRRIAARKERRKERAKQRNKESETSVVTNTSAVDVVATEDPPVPPAPIELPIHESDLETDETETDEDFYDINPQKVQNKSEDDKRSQILNEDTVSNGTIMDYSRSSTPAMPDDVLTTYKQEQLQMLNAERPELTPPPPPLPPPPPPTPKLQIQLPRQQLPPATNSLPMKRKIKSKKRKKKQPRVGGALPKEPMHSQMNIPKANYLNHNSSALLQQQQHLQSPVFPPTTPINSTPLTMSASISSTPVTAPSAVPSKLQLLTAQNAPGSGSETETSIRSSKRRRVPNKFYGYSSDEETVEKPPAIPVLKWRKSDLPSPATYTTSSPQPQLQQQQQQQQLQQQQQIVPPITIKTVPVPSPAPVVEPMRAAPVILHVPTKKATESDSEIEETHHGNTGTTDSSEDNRNDDSDSDSGQLHISQPLPPPPPPPPTGPAAHQHATGSGLMAAQQHQHHHHQQGDQQRTNENLYCYCQCPYDEVSEMIACDGKDCVIEWFHFECVGIMVPPKGKWYCPDCKKKRGEQRDTS